MHHCADEDAKQERATWPIEDCLHCLLEACSSCFDQQKGRRLVEAQKKETHPVLGSCLHDLAAAAHSNKSVSR